jgi:hypothetical protein
MPSSYLFYPDSESEFYITTDGQSAGLYFKKAPTWGLRSDFYYCHTVAGLLMWGALSDERMCLSFTTASYISRVILQYSFTNLI